ncbi:MAG: helix-hairpin-helix domain-containing protein [Gemmatimonadota bacterium]
MRAVILHARGTAADGRRPDPLHPGGVAGMTMQFVVGATPDSDRTIVTKIAEIYGGGGMHHAHFSAFRPIRDTPMEQVRATPVEREQRLYQADHLIRDYGFGAGEIVYDEQGNLPLARDPKVTWALASPERFPVEVRTASYAELVRVPGIGPVAARRIVAGRRSTTIRSLEDLRKLGVVANRAGGFLTIGGRRLRADRWAEQLGFWAPEEEAGRPQLVYEVSPGTFR